MVGKKRRAEHSSWWSEETRQGLLLKGRTMIIESPIQLIFRDLFYRLPAFAGSHDVFLKLEGFNITGSIKVNTALALVEDLEQRGIFA
jgi:cysteine synthase